MNLRISIPIFYFFLTIVLPVRAQEQFTLNGYVRDAADGETLIGATVIDLKTGNGAVTNLYGFYSITLPPGTYEIEFRFIGYDTEVRTVELNEDINLEVELKGISQQLEEVVVIGTRETDNVSGIQMSSHKLDINTIEKLPAFLGEVDVIKSIQLLPGVSVVGEGASGFNVRGGSVGQNLVLLDEAPVYNASHLLGFFSVFNPDAVKDVQLIKGGIPSKYGGRISSILDIRMKEGNSKKLELQGGVGTVFSRFAVEAPLVKDKASFLLAGRRSYADIIARPFTPALQDGAALNFYDLTFKTNYNIDAKNRVFLSAYLGRDNFEFEEDQGFNWGSQTTTIRWNHIFNQKIFANFTLLYSNYDYDLAFGGDNRDRFDWGSQITTVNLKPEFTYFINPRNELIFGGEILHYHFQPANAVGISNGEAVDITVDRKNALETSLYLGNQQTIKNFTLQYGLRLSSFNYLGAPTTYYEFAPAIPGERPDIAQVFRADKWESIKDYLYLEPRFSLNYKINQTTSVKASYNRMLQYIHLVSNTTASNPLDIWIPSTNNLKPQIGQQWAAGWFKDFGDNNSYEFSLETYYKKNQNQVDYIDGAELFINQLIEREILVGKGRAYGIELMIKKTHGKLTGWTSYTLSRSELKIAGINRGEWYPARYDQLHNLDLVLFYETNSRWSFSANFTYKSGTPTTFPTSKFQVQDYTIPYVFEERRNNTRIPNFNRLDLSATLKGRKIRKRSGKERKNEDYWVFSIYNVYNRRNPFSIYFAQQDERPAMGEPVRTRATQVSIIGSIVPAVSYNFKF